MPLFKKSYLLCITIILIHASIYGSTRAPLMSSKPSTPRQQSMMFSKISIESVIECLFAAKGVGCSDLIKRLSEDFLPKQVVLSFVDNDNGTQALDSDALRKTFIANAMIGAEDELTALLHNPERKKLITDNDLYQALSAACILGHLTIIECLLEQYPDLDSTIAPKSRLSLLCFAIKCSHTPLVAFMLKQKAFSDCLKLNGAIDMVLSCAIDCEKSQEMLKLLMESNNFSHEQLSIDSLTRAMQLITLKSEKVVATLNTLTTLQKQFKQRAKSAERKKK